MEPFLLVAFIALVLYIRLFIVTPRGSKDNRQHDNTKENQASVDAFYEHLKRKK